MEAVIPGYSRFPSLIYCQFHTFYQVIFLEALIGQMLCWIYLHWFHQWLIWSCLAPLLHHMAGYISCIFTVDCYSIAWANEISRSRWTLVSKGCFILFSAPMLFISAFACCSGGTGSHASFVILMEPWKMVLFRILTVMVQVHWVTFYRWLI